MNTFITRHTGIAASILATVLLMVGFAAVATFSAPSVHAQDQKPFCGPAQDPEEDDCRRVEREEIRDPALDGNDAGLIENYLNPIINFLAIIVGIVVTISIVAGGIQYASSADDPQKVAKAKSRIINAVLALLAFLFLYAFLQWLVPGGFLN